MYLLELLLIPAVLYLLVERANVARRLREIERRLGELQTPAGRPAGEASTGDEVAAALAIRLAQAEQEAAARTGNDGPSPQSFPAGAEAGPPVRDTLAGLFERFVGGRLLIWVGGIALAVAGVFLVRHSIALVTPEARMFAAALFGLLLIAAGEYARAGRLLADEPRIGQALVGAGLAVLYATAYGSHLLFGLIGSGTASAAMLTITAAALGLSLRHGAPTALMGLAGGFLTPLLVGDPKAGALPVLFYLALLDAAIFAIAWRRGWTWLAAAAVAASFAWTGYFVLEPPRDALPAGLFAAAFGIAASLPRPRQGAELGLIQPAVIALLEIAILTARPDIGLPGWLLFGGLAAATLPLSVIRPNQWPAPVAALLLGLLLIAVKAELGGDPFVPQAAVAATLLFGLAAMPLARSGDPVRALTVCAGLAGPAIVLRLLQPELLSRPLWGALAAALALLALLLLRLVRTGSGRSEIAAYAAGLTAALLLAFAGYDLAPMEAVSGAWLAAAVALLLAGVRLPDKALRLAGLLLLTATILKVFLVDAADLEGILRILSFFGLGAALIWIGRFYPRVLNAERKGAK